MITTTSPPPSVSALLGLLLLSWACGSKQEPSDSECKNGICANGTSATGGTSSGQGGAGGKGGAGSGSGATGGDGTNGGASVTGGTSGSGGDAGEAATSGGNTTGGGAGNGGGAASGGNSGGSGGSSMGGSGPCVESWLCSPWQTDGSSDDAARTCTDTQGCGTIAAKPVETVTLPALDLNFYKCEVEPILDRKCSMLGCHGKEQGRPLRMYSRGRLRITGEMLVESTNNCLKQGQAFPSERCTGSIECRCYTEPHTPTEWRRNFDSARSFALDASGDRLPPGDEPLSDLVAQPVVGGKAHAGIHLFRDTDADYQTLVDWLAGATLSTCTTNN